MKPIVHRFESGEALFDAYADRWAALARRYAEQSGAFHVALSGGGAPRWVFERLAGREDVPWEMVHVWIGDERCVAEEHPDSNFGVARRTLLDRVPIPAGQLHPMVLDPDDPAADARRYDTLLGERLPPGPREVPRFDLMMLGLGPDGHIASLFPDSAALIERRRWAVENFVEKLGVWRLTVTYPVIEAAAHLLFLVPGTGKGAVLARLFGAGGDGESLPVERIHSLGEVEWFVESAALEEGA
ncbi:6-phosphogluconolactonase [Endothiovibrio diazotrophicus]